MLHHAAVATKFWMPPGHNCALRADGGKCMMCGLNVLYMTQLILDFAAVSARSLVTPGDNRAIFSYCSESALCRLDMLHMRQMILNMAAIAWRKVNLSQLWCVQSISFRTCLLRKTYKNNQE